MLLGRQLLACTSSNIIINIIIAGCCAAGEWNYYAVRCDFFCVSLFGGGSDLSIHDNCNTVKDSSSNLGSLTPSLLVRTERHFWQDLSTFWWRRSRCSQCRRSSSRSDEVMMKW